MTLKISNIKYKYKNSDKYVLSDITLSINNENVVILLGNNGCGKTTLLHIIEGFLRAAEGDMYYNDINLKTISVMEHSKLIAYVTQKVYNYDDVMIRDYLSFAFTNDLKFWQRPTDAHIKQVEECAKKFGIYHLLEKNINEISGGERQIVSICSAVLQSTPIIILDEPTSALDMKNQHMVLRLLKEIAEDEHKTIILSSHNPNHALFLNAKVALMKNGKIVLYDNAQNVIKPEILSSIYGEDICYSNDLKYKEISFK